MLAGKRRHLRTRLFNALDTLYARFADPRKAIVILGFSRSGTTFLLEALAALSGRRSVFEPTSDLNPQALSFLHPHIYALDDGRRWRTGVPYRAPAQRDPALEAYMADVLRGNVHTVYARLNRTPASYRTIQVIVKDVQANLFAAWLAKTFGAKIILLYRHPCAVVDSVLHVWPWWPQAGQFLAMFLDQPRLIDDWLTPHMDRIQAENRDALARAALGYSIAYAVPFAQVERGDFNPLLVRYEDLVLDPEASFARVCAFAGAPFDMDTIRRVLDTPSRSSIAKARVRATPRERVYGWQDTLAPEDIDRIVRIVRGFGDAFADVVLAT